MPYGIRRLVGFVFKSKLNNAQIYHGLSNDLPLILPKGIKKVVTIHDLIFLKYPNTYPFVDRLIYKQKSKYSCKKADLIIAVSQSTKQDIMIEYGIKENKIVVIPPAVDLTFFEKNQYDGALHQQLSNAKPFILCVGSVTERKNILNLIKAFALLHQKVNHNLIIVGKGKEYLEKCKLLVQKLKIDNRVQFLENVIDIKDLKYLYYKASLTVYPSIYEGFGMPIAESLACGTVVVASQTSAMPEAGGSDMLYFNPFDEQDIATKILEVLTNKELSEKMKVLGKEYVLKNFHPQAIQKQIKNSYHHLLAK